MTKQILFRIWVIGIYLRFGLPARSLLALKLQRRQAAPAKAGAWDLVLPIIISMRFAQCSLLKPGLGTSPTIVNP
jgi:hypothetical protein